MKKFSFILVLVLVLPLMACSKEKNVTRDNTTQPAQEINTNLNKDDENALEGTPSSEDGPDYEAKPNSLVSDDNSKDTTSSEKLLEKPIEEKDLVEVDIMDPENEYQSVPLYLQGRVGVDDVQSGNKIRRELVLVFDHALSFDKGVTKVDRFSLGVVKNYVTGEDGDLYYSYDPDPDALGAGYSFKEGQIISCLGFYNIPTTQYQNINCFLTNVQKIEFLDAITEYPQVQPLSNFQNN